MGAKKIGVTDVENGKELYISLDKVEGQSEESRTSREKYTLECYMSSETTVCVSNNEGMELFKETIGIQDEEDQHLLIVIANATVGNGYHISIDSKNGVLKKKLYFEPTR